MATPKLTPPLVIAFTGKGKTNTCMHAEYSGVQAEITLWPIQWNSDKDWTLWQFGSDGRIYLYTSDSPAQFCVGFENPTQNGQPLQLTAVAASDKKQKWDWDTQPWYILNLAEPEYAIDNSSGNTNPGNRIQIWKKGNTPNQIWTPLMMPTYYLNHSEPSTAATAAAS